MTGSKAQLVNGICLLVSFGLCRLVWGSYQSILLYKDFWEAWQYIPGPGAGCESVKLSGTEIPVGCRVMPAWLAVTYVGGTTVLSILNFWWFGKMIAAVRKRFVPKEEGAKTHGGDKKKQ